MVSKVLRAYCPEGEKVAVAIPLKSGKVLQMKLKSQTCREEFASLPAWIEHLGGLVEVREEVYLRPKKVKALMSSVPDHHVVEAVRLLYYTHRIKDTLASSGRAKKVVPRLYIKLSDEELLPVYFNSKKSIVATNPNKGAIDPATLAGGKFYIPEHYALKLVEPKRPNGLLVAVSRWYAPEDSEKSITEMLSGIGDMKFAYISSSRSSGDAAFMKESLRWYTNVLDVRFNYNKTMESIRNVRTGTLYATFDDARKALS